MLFSAFAHFSCLKNCRMVAFGSISILYRSVAGINIRKYFSTDEKERRRAECIQRGGTTGRGDYVLSRHIRGCAPAMAGGFSSHNVHPRSSTPPPAGRRRQVSPQLPLLGAAHRRIRGCLRRWRPHPSSGMTNMPMITLMTQASVTEHQPSYCRLLSTRYGPRLSCIRGAFLAECTVSEYAIVLLSSCLSGE